MPASSRPHYDEIGKGYAVQRQPDSRIAAQVAAAIGDAVSILNVGAGAGSYEPSGVIAVEPSREMIAQRPVGNPAVQGIAEALPFRSGAFDGAMAVLTIHHWTDPVAGLCELRRVARGRVVLLTFDPDWIDRFWLVSDYFPAMATLDRGRMPAIDAVAAALNADTIDVVPIPADCTDGFLGAYWQRPNIYLDRRVRNSMSAFTAISAADTAPGLSRLADDLENGAWDSRHGHLRTLKSSDLGYRLVIAG